MENDIWSWREGNILDRNNVDSVNCLPVYFLLAPRLSALQAVGVGRRNINRKLVLATHIISVKHGLE